MLDGNTAALDQFERQQLANEVRYEQLKARADESELMALAEDRMWQDHGFMDGLMDNQDAIVRLALFIVRPDLLPANYATDQKALDEKWFWSYTDEFVAEQYAEILDTWIKENWNE